MPYLNTHDRTSAPTGNDKFQPMGRTTALFGVFVGFVKDAADVQRNGRLRVWIPEFGSAPDNSNGWIIVNYCSPFAGATNNETTSKANVETFEGTQTSYGMWMIPPDINNQVLIMFINGDASRGIWIGSLYNQYMNNMVPGMPIDSKNWQYPGKFIPAAEYNKWDTKVTQPDRAFHPYEKTKFKGLGNQGLITDQGRGITTSGARRESPSNVFGILTPGPAIDETASPDNIRRKGGSSFIMDDGTGSEYVQLTTKSGAQVRLDETNGFVYLINRDGTAWVQMDQKGNIDIFGATNISMRSQQDINMRADRNINIEAGQNIYLKAAKDTISSTTTFTYDVNNVPNESSIPYYKYVGEDAGEGGNIVLQALNNMHSTVKKNVYLTVKENNLEIKVQGTIDISASGEYNLTASNIKNNGPVKIIGTVEITDAVKLNKGLSMVGTLHAANGSFSNAVNALTGEFPGLLVGRLPGISSGKGAFTGGTQGSNGKPFSIPTPPDVTPAEVKQQVEKINILATWSDPESKFKRNSEAIQTTVSTLPTYEPCPEHETFIFSSITGYTPIQSDGAKTYPGSGGAGSEAPDSPPTNTTPGANNTDIPPTPADESAVTKQFNMNAYQCQLKIHEGIKYTSYIDSVGLPTGGIGHLLRRNELSKYPVPTPIPSDQVDQWFQQDAIISISGAQRLLTIDSWAGLTDIRKRACADLCYNLGEGKFSKFTRFLASIRAGDYNAAGDSLRNSKWFTQVGRRGPNIITMIVNNVDPNGCDKKFPA